MYSQYMQRKQTPQSQAIPGSSQVPNSGGGFSFKVSPKERLSRFLILGSEGGSYYASEKELTQENAKAIIDLIKHFGSYVVKEVVRVLKNGEAPKFKPAIFTLALCATYGNEEAKKESYAAIYDSCRTGTQLFYFCQCIQDMRGWSRGLRSGVSNFYTNRTPDSLAYQLIKYRQRDGWTHKDVLRLAHPKTNVKETNELFSYAVGKEMAPNDLIQAFETLQKEPKLNLAVDLIKEYGLPWEAIPTELLKQKVIWEALLPDMGMTALLRNLARMTSIGLLDSNTSAATKVVVKRLGSEDEIKRGQLHPLNILNAHRVYARGYGDKGSLRWDPLSKVVDTLNDAFYKSFKTVEPTEKTTLIGLDVSSSMEGARINGMALTAREASAALCMVTAKTESFYDIVAFSNGLTRLTISPAQRLDDILKAVERLSFSSTDCSLPILAALHNNLKIETFIIYTDSETNTGSIHPVQALNNYREKTGIPAKLIVVAMTANDFTIADKDDSGMLDVVGFSTSTPKLIADFSRGKI